MEIWNLVNFKFKFNYFNFLFIKLYLLENIMVSKQNKIIKIVDFGLSISSVTSKSQKPIPMKGKKIIIFSFKF